MTQIKYGATLEKKWETFKKNHPLILQTNVFNGNAPRNVVQRKNGLVKNFMNLESSLI